MIETKTSELLNNSTNLTALINGYISLHKDDKLSISYSVMANDWPFTFRFTIDNKLPAEQIIIEFFAAIEYRLACVRTRHLLNE